MQYGVIASRINTAAQAGQMPSTEGGETILDFGMSDANRATARDEEFRSSLRLLYVALTRASLITYLYTRQLAEPSAKAMNFTNSAQGALLMSHERCAAEPGEKSAGTIVEQRWESGYFTGSKDLLPQPTAAWWTDLDEPENDGTFHIRRNGVFERHFGMRDDIGPLRPDDAPESLAAAEFTGAVRDDCG